MYLSELQVRLERPPHVGLGEGGLLRDLAHEQSDNHKHLGGLCVSEREQERERQREHGVRRWRMNEGHALTLTLKCKNEGGGTRRDVRHIRWLKVCAGTRNEGREQ